MEFLNEAMRISGELNRIRRRLHENAEVGFELEKTVAIVKEELSGLGIEHKELGRSGVAATLGHGDSCVLLRADMDALTLCEDTGLDFASKNGNMHACGHDMHTAMLLGAARLLKAREEELSGQVRLMFQPAEEILEGARDMIDAGVLENPVPCAAVMIHIISNDKIPSGRLIVPEGGLGATAVRYFRIILKGRGCHGSEPSDGIDASLIAARVVLGLLQISGSRLAGNDVILTVGKINSGTAANAIADSAVIEGTLRSEDEENLTRAAQRICEISENTAKAYRGSATVEFTHACPALRNDRELSDKLYEVMCRTLGEQAVMRVNGRGGGSEDFSYVSLRVPSVMLALSAPDSSGYPLHHPRASFDEGAMPVGCAAYAAAAMALAKETKNKEPL